MRKVFIVLDEQELMNLEVILTDRDKDEALKFLKKSIVPKIKKKVPCKSLELTKPKN